MTTSRTLAAAAVITLATIGSTLAHAPTAHAQASDAATASARARFLEGVDFFDKGKYEDARASFKQAYALKPHFSIALNLAHSCVKTGHVLEAVKNYNLVLKDEKTPADKKAEAENGLAEARKKIGRLEILVANGSEIYLDGEKIGFAPIEIQDVDPGSHVVVTKGPHGASEQKVQVVAGQVLPVKFGAAPATTPAQPTTTAPTTTPPAQPAQPPVATTTPAPPTTTDATPSPAETPPATDATPAPETEGAPAKKDWLAAPRPLWPVYAAGGVAAAGLVTGIAFTVLKSSAQSSADGVEQTILTAAAAYKVPTTGVCNNVKAFPTSVQSQVTDACGKFATNRDNVNTDGLIATIGWVATVLGVAGGAGYYFFGPNKGTPNSAPAAARPLVTPWLSGGGGGLNVSGSF